MEGKKVVVLATTTFFLGLLILGSLYQVIRSPEPFELGAKVYYREGNPKANVNMVLIEDFRCHGCSEFTQNIFPRIQDKFINPGAVYFTLVPVAFLQGSKPIANAAMEVSRLAPDQFFAFVKEVFLAEQEGAVDQDTLLQIARNLGHIDLEQLQSCMEKRCHFEEIDENFGMGPQPHEKELSDPRPLHQWRPPLDRLLHRCERPDRAGPEREAMNKYRALYYAWFISLAGVVISLYYGEVLNNQPCNLCWYQRIALFPLAYLLGLAVYTNNLKLAKYCLPFAIFGAIFAAYHTMGQWFPFLERARICGYHDECAAPIFSFYGITFPILSVIGFLLITLLLFIAQKK